jgi:hypothetical protein
MLVTIANISGVALNALDSIDTAAAYGNNSSVAGLVATGGGVVKPLPYPFAHIGTLAIGASKQLPMNPRDWTYRSVPWIPTVPAQDWLVLVQKGWVTVTTAAEATSVDPEELFVHGV